MKSSVYRKLKCAFLLTFGFLTASPVAGQAVSDDDLLHCREQDDSLARLTCYDDLAAAISGSAMSIGAAYSAFEKLNFFEGQVSANGPYGLTVEGWEISDGAETWLTSLGIYEGFRSDIFEMRLDLSLIRQQSFLFDCYLFDVRMWRIDKNAFDGESIPPEQQLVATYELIVPLADVDLELTRASGEKTIVMDRGARVSSNSYGFNGWSTFDDLLPFTSYLGSGSFALNQHLTFLNSERERSVDATFARAYPEDQGRAFLAFVDLVKACQD